MSQDLSSISKNIKNGGKERREVSNTRYIAATGMLSAVAFLLMFFDFSVPFMPSFIKLDISELPALIGSFAMGPFYGVLICLVKNLLHLIRTSTGGVGELSNFIMGALLVFPAGLLYQKNKNRKTAALGTFVGIIVMALVSIPVNYFITYPFYTNFMPLDTIISMYQAILPSADSLLKCLVIFNVPFNIMKGLLVFMITMLVYKKVSPIIKGISKNR
ncbi:MAG: ECF transporter S component [Lachnospiraceae bacterium]|nr:ECF transporter S component [Lachnospiraceae bacterium]